jgi:hypothetical protein
MSGGPGHPLLALKGFDGYQHLSRKVWWTDPYTLGINGWDFRSILDQFPRMDFVVHDLTGLSPGVMFEIGCSRSLRRRTVFVWDTSRAPFRPRDLPMAMQPFNVVPVDFKNVQQLGSEVLRRIKAQLEEVVAPPLETEPEERSAEIVIVACPTCRETVTGELERMLSARNRKSFKTVSESSLDDLYASIQGSKYVIVASSDTFAEGHLALGMGQVRKKKVLELYSRNASGSSMSTSLKQEWTTSKLASDLEHGLNKLFETSAARA